MVQVYKILNETDKVNKNKLFTMSQSTRTRVINYTSRIISNKAYLHTNISNFNFMWDISDRDFSAHLYNNLFFGQY